MPVSSGLCPVCQGGTRLYAPATVDPGRYFSKSESYHIAAGSGKVSLAIWRCVKCGHGFTPFTLEPQALVDWYAASPVDNSYIKQEDARRQTARRVLKHLSLLVKERGRLLDVGAGPGFFVAEAVAAGWQAEGLEPSKWAVEFAHTRLKVASVRRGQTGDLSMLSREHYAVITAFDVIEHLINPHQFLTDCAQLLKPGGILILTMPRFDSFFARLAGKRWYCILPAHLHYFTRRSLRLSFQHSGFTLLHERKHVRYLGINYLWRRLRDYIGFKVVSPVSRDRELFVVPVNLGDEFEVYARKG